MQLIGQQPQKDHSSFRHSGKIFFLLLTFMFLRSNLAAQNYTPNTFADPVITTLNNSNGEINGGTTISLRSAVRASDNLGGTHIITLSTGTYNLTQAIPNRQLVLGTSLSQNVTINGNGPTNTIINMVNDANRDRILFINPSGNTNSPVVSVSGIRFQNGYLSSDPYGGAAICAGGGSAESLTITNCAFDNNVLPVGGYGGGAVCMQARGDLTINNCTFTNNISNDADGGAVLFIPYNSGLGNGQGNLVVTNSTFTGNQVTNAGGFGGALSFRSPGGAIYNNVNVTKNTFVNNTCTGSGGAIAALNSANFSTYQVHYNRFSGNVSTADASTSGMVVLATTLGSVDATNNWWGCNTGPSALPCQRATQLTGGTGTTTLTPYLQLKVTANSPICNIGANTSTVTAGFLNNSAGTAITAANVSSLVGLPVTWGPTVNGSLSGQQTTIQASGTATATFTSNGTGGVTATVNAQVDNVPNSEVSPSRASITVNTASVAPTGVTGTTNICNGSSTMLTVTGGSKGTAAVTQWFTGSCGGALVSTGDAYNVSPATTTTYYVRYSGTCNATTCVSVTVTVVNGYTWFGSNSTSWTDASNWSACGVPPPGADITIATTTNSPTLPAGTTVVGTLTMNAGININLGGNTLSITSISGLGAIAGSSTSNLIIAGTVGTVNFTQTSAATRSLNNLTLNAGSSATLGNALDVYGTVALTTATLNLSAQNLTLKSDITNTARIANLTGSTLSGATNVTVERYIKLRAGGTGRAYRLLAPTVTTTGTMKANWMEGGMNTVLGTNVNPVPLFGTHITGTGGNTNGFDVTQNNQASIYATTNAVTPTYTAITSTTTGAGATLNAKTGYFLFVRGDRSANIFLPGTSGLPTSSTTLRTTGTLLTGTQTTFTNAFAGGAGTKNLVTNPYASPIDWSLVQPACTGVTGSYTYWDANIGTRGGFATVTTGGISSPGTSATKFIQSGQAFFVEASGAPAPTVSIQESHKSAGNNNGVFKTQPTTMESFRTELYFTEANGYRRVADGVIALYDNKYKAAVDADDATEIGNWDENIAISRDGKKLAIEARPVILKNDDLPIYMNNMKKQAYEFDFTPSVFTNTNLKAELVDKFLGIRTLLSVTSSTTVAFTITDNPASAATDRFTVVFGSFGSPSGVDAITIKASRQNGGVQVDWTSKTETDMVKYEVEKSAYGTSFSKANTTTALGNSTTPVNYNWFDTNPTMGNNFYRIKGIDKAGNVRYSDMVKVLFGKGEPGIVVYPNPMTGKVFQVDMNNLAKGAHQLNLYNSMGQQVYSQKIQHDGSQAATQTIDLNMDVEQGVYQLQLIGDNGFKTTKSIIKN
jgi:hypothetical protein